MNRNISSCQSCSSFNPSWLLFNSGLIEISTEGELYRYQVIYRPRPNDLGSVFFSPPIESYAQAVIEARLRVLRMEIRRSNKLETLTDLATGRLLEQSHPHRRCFGVGTHPKPVLSQDLCKNPVLREQAIRQLSEEHQQLIQHEDNFMELNAYCFSTTINSSPMDLDGEKLSQCCTKREKNLTSLKLYCLSSSTKFLVETFFLNDC